MENIEDTMEIDTRQEEKLFIENLELRNFLEFTFQITQITKENLEKVDEIVLDSQNIVGQYNKVSFDEIALFPNLKKITIRNLGISLENMKRLQSISQIEFNNCEIDKIEQLQQVKSLTLIHTEVSNLEKIGKLENLEELQCIHMKIEDFTFLKRLKRLKKLVIKNVESFTLEKINFSMPIEYLSIEKIVDLDIKKILNGKNLKTVSVDRQEAENWKQELEDLKQQGIEILLNDIYEY